MNKNKPKRLIFATNNLHKLKEARQILPDGFEIVSLAEIGCHDDIPETADTLEGNALIKARWVHDKYGYDCFADDTGLMVDALGGAPGVLSARYAGEQCSPADNVAKLLKEMEGRTDRDAHFSTTVALICGGETHCFEGRVEGSIATEPHGNGGFGYDPVFIAKESGKCFAEMTAEQKNAISHRGRALRKLRDFLGVCIALIITCAVNFGASASEWRILPSYDGHMERIIDTPEFTYFLGASQEFYPQNTSQTVLYGVLYRYDSDSGELLALNSENYLSSTMVSAIEYNFKKKYLAIGYLDGNIDLLYDDGKVVNIPGIKLADSSLAKGINHISFDKDFNEMIVATDFGIVMIDAAAAQVRTSCVFNEPIRAAAFFDNRIWIVKADGVFRAPAGNVFVKDFEYLDNQYGVGHRMLPTENALYLLVGGHNNMATIRISRSQWGDSFEWKSGDNTISAERTADGVMLTYRDKIILEKSDGTQQTAQLPPTVTLENDEMNAGSYDGRNFWFSTGRTGISQWKRSGESWTMLQDKFMPNAASAFHSYAMAYHPDYGMLVRNHGQDWVFNGTLHFNTDDLICAYRNMEWTPISTAYHTTSKGLVYQDPRGISIDPKNRNHVYCASHLTGLLRLDLANPNNSIHMSHASDPLGGYGHPGFAVITDPIESDWMRSSFATPEFDVHGNMWTMYIDNSVPSNYSSNHVELLCWTPQARAATTSASNVQPFLKIDIPNEPTTYVPTLLALKYGSHKNMLFIFGNQMDGTKSSIIIYDHNGTPGDTSDDRMTKINFVNDQDGNSYEINRIYSIYEDPTTGTIWIGALDGLFTFDLKDISGNSALMRRIKVPRNDGTNLADYLLDQTIIAHITSDSSGRKLFSTLGSGLVRTTADGRQILDTFTPENSGIPSNHVYFTCENPENNSLMVSTKNGICEYFMNSNGGSESKSDVRAYPNPVEARYAGYVTIDGLPSDAMVKILDAHANLVKECGMASNGEIRWNLTDNAFKRVPGGVYYIVATNGPNSNSYSKMGKVLVIE